MNTEVMLLITLVGSAFWIGFLMAKYIFLNKDKDKKE